MLLVLWVTGLSTLVILYLEKQAASFGPPHPARGKRLLIPLPILLLVAADLDALLAWDAHLQIHPDQNSLRILRNLAWDGDRLINPALLVVLILPFLISPSFRSGKALALRFWAAYLIWIVLAGLPLAVAHGDPFQD